MIIKHQKGRGTKIHILLDDEYTVTTDENFWFDNYIPDGTEITDEEWNELLVKINYKKALNKCADLLSRRDHSVKELKAKLLRTVDEVSAQRAVDRYVEAGYLNDERYCERLVEYLFETKKYSPANVRQECFKRGIDREIIDRVMSEYDVDTVSSIVDLLNTKYRSKLLQGDGFKKVIASLQRKGFRYSDIKSAFYRLEDYDE